MGWNTIFLIANYWAIAFWLLLAFAPRGPRLLSAVMYAGVFLLCLVYVILITGFLTGDIDPGGAGGATLGWVHYLAFDLFVGLWIARDADNKGFSRIIQLPFLFLTLMAGPVGLFLWLIVRERRARAAAKAQ